MRIADVEHHLRRQLENAAPCDVGLLHHQDAQWLAGFQRKTARAFCVLVEGQFDGRQWHHEIALCHGHVVHHATGIGRLAELHASQRALRVDMPGHDVGA